MVDALNTFAPQLAALAARGRGHPTPRISQLVALAACAPPASLYARSSQLIALSARSAGAKNVTASVSQVATLAAYGSGVPVTQVANSWTFVLDGHRFWVLSLGPEGDWAYDTTTKQWCQLITQGYPGLNFRYGTMWLLRIMGGDALYPTLYEFDPNQPDDEGFRPVQHIVTGGLSTRTQNKIGVANFRITATTGLLSDVSTTVELSFNDENGNPDAWVTVPGIEVPQGSYQTQLQWNALGSYSAPGRIFQILDQGGPLSIYGADVALGDYDEDNGGGGSGGSQHAS